MLESTIDYLYVSILYGSTWYGLGERQCWGCRSAGAGCTNLGCAPASCHDEYVRAGMCGCSWVYVWKFEKRMFSIYLSQTKPTSIDRGRWLVWGLPGRVMMECAGNHVTFVRTRPPTRPRPFTHPPNHPTKHPSTGVSRAPARRRIISWNRVWKELQGGHRVCWMGSWCSIGMGNRSAVAQPHPIPSSPRHERPLPRHARVRRRATAPMSLSKTNPWGGATLVVPMPRGRTARAERSVSGGGWGFGQPYMSKGGELVGAALASRLLRVLMARAARLAWMWRCFVSWRPGCIPTHKTEHSTIIVTGIAGVKISSSTSCTAGCGGSIRQSKREVELSAVVVTIQTHS